MRDLRELEYQLKATVAFFDSENVKRAHVTACTDKQGNEVIRIDSVTKNGLTNRIQLPIGSYQR